MKQTLQQYDTVRLTTKALKANIVTLDKQSYPTAKVEEICNLIDGDIVLCILNRPLNGTTVWAVNELARVKKGHPPTVVKELPLKLYRGFMPSNFSRRQMAALRAFEVADTANQQPAKDHTTRRKLRSALFSAHQAVVAAYVPDALCQSELDRLNFAYASHRAPKADTSELTS